MKKFILLSLLLIANFSYSQIRIGKWFFGIPTTEPIDAPTGSFYYDNTANTIRIKSNSAWFNILDTESTQDLVGTMFDSQNEFQYFDVTGTIGLVQNQILLPNLGGNLGLVQIETLPTNTLLGSVGTGNAALTATQIRTMLNVADGAEVNTDSQTLSLSGNTLSISSGNTVDLSSIAGNGGGSTQREFTSSTNITPSTSDIGKIITTTSNTAITVNAPSGTYSAGNTIIYQQGGEGKILIDFTDNITQKTTRTPERGSAIAIDFDGTDWNVIGKYEFVDATDPNVPTGLAASNITQTSLTFTWNAATDNNGGSGIAGYAYSVDDAAQVVIGNITSVTLNSLTTGQTYNFKVKAIDNEGNESAFSTSINATTLTGNLYTTANAANPISDDNSTTGVTSVLGSFVPTVESSLAISGVRSIRLTADVNGSSAAQIALGTLENNTSYTVTFKVYRGSAAFSNFQTSLSENYGWLATDSSSNVTTVQEWETISLIATTTSTTPSLRISLTSIGEIGDWILVDDIVVTEN